MQLPAELQKELVEKAAVKFGNCQELAKHLNIPKSSVHYYMIGRLTMPVSILSRMIEIASDELLEARIAATGITKDRMWAIWHAKSVFIESCKEKLRLPTTRELETDDELRRKAAAIVSYVLAEGSIWLGKEKWGEHVVNITFADHEADLYEHFRLLCRDVFRYDIGLAQKPGNEAKAIRGFIYSRFIAEWLIENGVLPGEKASQELHLPAWVMGSKNEKTWISALQPWCDGEGSVRGKTNSGSPSFSIAQSRHTDLSVDTIPLSSISSSNRCVGTAVLHKLEFLGIKVIEYCRMNAKSELLSDVHDLFLRLGTTPTVRISHLYLKDDGFWSCIWTLNFGVEDTRTIMRLGLVKQERKRRALGLEPDKYFR